MAAAAQSATAITAAQTSENPTQPKIPAWKHLLGLAPYLRRYRGKLMLGTTFLLAGAIIGALLPLVIGTIVDSLSG